MLPALLGEVGARTALSVPSVELNIAWDKDGAHHAWLRCAISVWRRKYGSTEGMVDMPPVHGDRLDEEVTSTIVHAGDGPDGLHSGN